jgi:hypothetical protein
MDKGNILLSSIMILSLLCYCKKKKEKKIKIEIPKISEPWLYLQFGGPGIERTV